MPTYVYETIPRDTGEEPRRFDVIQKMSDPPLTNCPTTGLPVRKIITGGGGIRTGILKRSTVVDKTSPAATACGCTTGRPHRHTPYCGH